MQMVSMKKDPEEASEGVSGCINSAYPYGLELRLDDSALAKLGLTQPPAVGTAIMISAQVTVTEARASQDQEGEIESSSCWQITDMAIEPASSTSATAAGLLYPEK